jgi:hypothetical protein
MAAYAFAARRPLHDVCCCSRVKTAGPAALSVAK